MDLNLKGRLKLIADKVPACKVVADIGTDHAYIPIYLIQEGICTRAIASDVRTGPVEVANRNITLYKLNDNIETRLGSGLDTLKDNEADVVIVAGMGGTLLTELLDSSTEKTQRTMALILQPMNDLDVVRKWLFDHGFEIYDEELAAEGDKIYCVLAARYNGNSREHSEFQLHVGDHLIHKRDPLLISYCEMKIRQIDRVLGQLKAMDDNTHLMNYYLKLKENYLDLLENIKAEG